VSTSAVECRALVKRYGKQTAVDAIDLDISPGECFGLLGPNGAGKTTTVEILEGLSRPDSGTVSLFGIGWQKGRDQELRERIGVQLQETQLGDKLFVVEVFELFRSFYREGRSVDDLITLLDLEPERRKAYSKLSGGQKQRVALGCALVGKPDLLFLDEPTTGLDPRARRAIWGVVERFRADGGTVLLTTHYMEEATALCDRIAIMDHGKIIARGTPRALVDGLGLVQFVEFEASAPLDEAALGALAVVSYVEKRRGRYRLRIDRSLAALRGVLAELERQNTVPIGLSTHQATLDDVFLQLTGRGLQGDQPAEGNSNGSSSNDAVPGERAAS
jgi:ABC-2 type transport system ATP-binding protein